MIPRLYIQEKLSSGLTVPIEESQLHYIRNVLRLGSGSHIHIFNGNDGEWSATLDIYNKKNASLKCQDQLRPQDTEHPLTLMCALIKPQRMELLIEKATELGVTKIVPLLTDHCAVRKMNLERLLAHAVEAAEQCERLSVPEITPLRPLREALSDQHENVLWADESRDQMSTVKDTLNKTDIHSILIGPEGGFSEAEKEYLRTRPHIHPVHMGKLILRAETAAIALVAVVQALR